MNGTLDYRERADGLGVGGAAPNWRRGRVPLSVRKPAVFKAMRADALILIGVAIGLTLAYLVTLLF